MSSDLVEVFRDIQFNPKKCYSYSNKTLGKEVETRNGRYYTNKKNLTYLGNWVKTQSSGIATDGSTAREVFINNGEERMIDYDYDMTSTWFAKVPCGEVCVGCSISGGTRNKKRKNRKSIRRKSIRRKSIRRKSYRSR
jgi:hypothetical protein